jgi:hypothetical protein
VSALVPQITRKTWNREQTPSAEFLGVNFPLARQVSTLAPPPPMGKEAIIPTRPTHVSLLELLEVFKEAGGKGGVVHKLPRGTLLTHVRTEDGWMLLAKDGKELGYISRSYDAPDKLLAPKN